LQQEVLKMKSNPENEVVSRFSIVREMEPDELMQEAQELVTRAEHSGEYEEYLLISQCAHTYRQLTGEALFVHTEKYGTIDWLHFHSMQANRTLWLN
jgi:FtsZ-interacting cell division protein ZipA